MLIAFGALPGFTSAQDADRSGQIWPRPRPAAVSIGQERVADFIPVHPVAPLLQIARRAAEHPNWNCDYTCVLALRERIDERLGGFEYIELKVRQYPRSYYLRVLEPSPRAATEALYVAGQNDDMLWARSSAWARLPSTTLSLAPDSPWLREGRRCALSELTMADLLARSTRELETDAQFGECEARIFPGAKVEGRSCTCLQVMHPVPRRNFAWHLSRLYLDDETSLAVRFEGYAWPTSPGGEPVLAEEYTFTQIQLDAGLNDNDFDPRNRQYGFNAP